MSGHQKRLSVPDSWPVERKTATWSIAAGAGPHGEAGVPLLVLLRDVLGYVDSRKEARYALARDSVLVNGDAVDDESRPVGMFDILAFPEREEHFRAFPDEGGRLALSPIAADDAESKLGKIVDKRAVDGDTVQLNLHDGMNLTVGDEPYGTGDSLVVDNDTGEVVAHFPYEEGALVTAVAGAHAGDVGVLESVEVTPGSSPNNVTVETDDGTFETVEEYVVVIDENFVEDAPPGDEGGSDDAGTEAADGEGGSDEAAADEGDDADGSDAADADEKSAAGSDGAAEASDDGDDEGGDGE